MSRSIGLLFDPHIVAGKRRKNDGVAIVEKAIDKLNAVGVDWTLIGGDIRSFVTPTGGTTEWGTWHGDPENYYYRNDFAEAKKLFDEQLESDYYVIRGNNDRPLDVFREFFPEDDYPLWYWFEDDAARYVFLDSNPNLGFHILDERQNFITAPQLSMLERLMDDDPTIPTFVFCHSPLAKHTEIQTDWETHSMGAYYITLNYPSVQYILERGNTVIVNTGHYYRGNGRGSKRVNDIEYVNARHLVHGSDPAYGGDVRWMTVDSADRNAEVHYYDIGADEQGQLVTTSW